MNITLGIDGKNITVHSGATILDAARKAGARVPTLCQDDRLHAYGGCRICMVEVAGPPKRMLPACTTPAADGMSVLTSTPALIEARRSILELLLINHPLDCPVCDKAGECRLQDLVHEYGLGPSQFAEEKRTFPPVPATVGIERNQNRCILCGKCVRVCSEQCGVGALTFSMRGRNTRISTAFETPLACEFCGECLEICPVGALTQKQGKYRSRPWNVEQTATVCPYCGCGCPLTIETRNGEVVRAQSFENRYLCARGRFGWDAVEHESRLTTPKIRINGKLVDATWDEALSVIATHLNVIKNRSGSGHIGGLGSVRTTNEDNYVFQRFMRTAIGTNNVDFLTRSGYPYGLNSLYFAGQLSRMGEHDVILVLEKDVAEINSLTGIEIVRAASRSVSRIIVIGEGRSKFDRVASVSIPRHANEMLPALIAALRNKKRIASTRIKHSVELLSSSVSTAIVLPAHVSPDNFGLIQELANLLKRVTYYPTVTRGNIQGALDLGILPHFFPGYRSIAPDSAAFLSRAWNAPVPSEPGMNAAEMMRAAERSQISALYIMGDDPVGSDAWSGHLLGGLEFLVVQDIFLTETAKIANVVLPAAGFLEKSGTMTNIERRLRQLAAAAGQLADARPDWRIIQELSRRMGVEMRYATERDIMQEIRMTVPLYEALMPGSCWGPERSPLRGMLADLSLPAFSAEPRDGAVGASLVFSSGMMTTRSAELKRLATAHLMTRRDRLHSGETDFLNGNAE